MKGGFRLRFRVWGSLLGEGTVEQLQSLKANNDVPRTQAKRCARTGENGNENKDIKHVPYVAPGGLAEWGQAGAEARKKPLPGEEAHGPCSDTVPVVLFGGVFRVEQGLKSTIEDQAYGHASAPDHRQVGEVLVLRLLVVLQGQDRLCMAACSVRSRRCFKACPSCLSP